MNAPAIFAFNAAAVRVFSINNAPWFMATEVAGILGYRNAPDMTRMLDEDEADTHLVRIRSETGVIQDREVSIISESGLYAAIFKSKRAEAKAFRKWVTSEVLPAIRRQGSYAMPEAGGPLPEYSNPLSLSHRADITVSADRTFRAMMRSGRAAGLLLPQALRRANEITIQKTGVDMLHELGAEDMIAKRPVSKGDPYGIYRFFSAWIDGSLPIPFTVCRSTQLFRAYAWWAQAHEIEVVHVGSFFRLAHAHRDRFKKTMVTCSKSVRAIVPIGAKIGVPIGEWTRYVELEMEKFSSALQKWEG